MAETQIIFRLDKKILKDLDESLKISGFKTRNEWFRAAIRDFLGDREREKVLRKLKKLEIKGLEDKDISEMIDKWRHEKK
ncbi:MAG: ribbon-helix-helix domain-containing protein [Euryarchaeota archaeon]|nr:ribbon-helix-helix domain-containing protein [Euryarchaeota archaeon]MBU4222284.1 ribbon-helix-helix domain-containing protein [Euryarchaeota archaeon]MBU4339913.1 ribbon-helix-helix domain-containing protein [Euryarchaeota archaeon]MCG2735381.1 ribbon-helix-helix domain-containing protein [Candidatus Methanoperedenaceae archaeon]